jgi:hypothetical protein
VHGLKRQADRRGQAHRVAFTEWAWQQIEPAIALPTGPLLFPAGVANTTLEALRQATGIHDWKWHDLRRSFGVFAGKERIGRDAAEAVLGHVLHSSKVDKAYMQHKFEHEAERAFHTWQQHIARLVAGRSESNVIALKQ